MAQPATATTPARPSPAPADARKTGTARWRAPAPERTTSSGSRRAPTSAPSDRLRSTRSTAADGAASAACARQCARSRRGSRTTRSAEMMPQQRLPRFAQQIERTGAERRNERDAEYRQGPQPWRRQHGPAQQHQQRQRNRNETAAQVVQHLPARQGGKRVPRADAIGARHARQQPVRDLPVAANPAVASLDVRAVARRIVLVQLDVAQQPGARVATLEQVVAQDAVFRQTLPQRELERVDVVDALADERAFTEDVLVDVRYGARVRVDAGVARVQPRIQRT